MTKQTSVPYHSGMTSFGDVVEVAEPLQRFERDGNVALANDMMISSKLPLEFSTVDCIYSEPPWITGLTIYDERAGLEHTADRNLRRLMTNSVEAITSLDVPKVLVVGRHAARFWPEPDQLLNGTVNGGNCLIYITGLTVPFKDGIATEVVLEHLAMRPYQRVGDPFCGYGRAGRAFRRQGKGFVLSDLDPRCIGVIARDYASWSKVEPLQVARRPRKKPAQKSA
jgi:hypothetical protein